jgi:hypothetical protein
MNTSMNTTKQCRRRWLSVGQARADRRWGFTIIEMTVAIGLSIGVASAGLGVIAQHTEFMSILKQFDFLRDDAPQINNVMSRLTGQAVSYRIYPSKQDAFDNANAVNTNGTALRLIFRNPNGSMDQSVVAFEENLNNFDRLNFYQFNGGWPATYDWTISTLAAGVVFEDASGILEMTLTGPNGEQISYSATAE